MATAASAATLFACIQVLQLSGRADVLRGQGKEFEAIITAVIGGTLLTGGYGSALGSAFGAFILGMTQLGIVFAGINTDWYQVVLGAMLLLAVLVNNYTPPPRLGSPLMRPNEMPPMPHDTAPFTLPAETAERSPPTASAVPDGAAAGQPVLEARDVSKYFGAGRRPRGRLAGGPAGRGQLPPRRQRRRQVDAHQDPVGRLPARLGQPRHGRRAGHAPVARATPSTAGIATVYQDLAVLPLMSISRNFFLGSEPTDRLGPVPRFDVASGRRGSPREQMLEIGIDVRDTGQLVGTLSGGERQTVAIARAEYFGARVLILDEPTSALGVKEAAIVLRHVIRARAKGLGVIFITHNVQHALPVGDRFTILSHGRLAGEFLPRAGQPGRAAAADGRRRGAGRAGPRARRAHACRRADDRAGGRRRAVVDTVGTPTGRAAGDAVDASRDPTTGRRPRDGRDDRRRRRTARASRRRPSAASSRVLGRARPDDARPGPRARPASSATGRRASPAR